MHEDHIIGDKSERPPCCQNKKKICIIIVIVIAVVGIFLWVAGIFESKYLPESLQALVDDDPFDGVVYRWQDAFTTSSGLSITIVDALEEKYHNVFELAVNDWNSGTPDVLHLRTRAIFPDPECKSQTGSIRVCNADYGPTNWKGQNSVLLRDNEIYASVAKMNDFYLDRSNDATREYIMCHELGHGLGLPHTDEWFWNFDQGNCMDYTSRPQNNRKPGQVSFDRLAQKYGPTAKYTTTTGGGSKSGTVTSTAQSEGDSLIDIALKMFDEATKASEASGEVAEVEQIDIGAGYSVMIRRMLA